MDYDLILPNVETEIPESVETDTETNKEEVDIPTTETEKVEESPRKIKIKYNHEEKELEESEVVTLAQKGMNYDKLQEKFNALQNDSRLSKYEKVKQLGELYNMTDDDLIEGLYNQYYASEADKKGISEEQVRKDHELNRREQEIKVKEQQEKEIQKKNEMYDNFWKRFPDVDVKQIKQSTWDKVNSGVDLTLAYIEQVNDELNTKVKTLETIKENSKKAPIKTGVSSHGSGSVLPEDPFLAGFNSL